MRTLAFRTMFAAVGMIFALNTGIAFAADPPKAATAKTEAVKKKKAKKKKSVKKTPAPAASVKK